jgi:hypothetical protein
MKNYKILTIFGLPYLFVCGGLYNIAYWGTFRINGLAYIGLSELIKSVVHPCVYFIGIFLLSTIISEGILRLNKVLPHGGGRHTPVGEKLNSNWGISIHLVLWLSIVIFLYSYGNVNRWLPWAIIAGIAPMIFLDRIGLWSNDFDDSKLRIHAIRIFVFLPILSFASGKYQSELIYQNIQYQYITSDTIVPYWNSSTVDTLKYLGNVDQYILLTDFNNSKIVFVRNDKLDVFQLRQK